jgi:acyl-CoA hydrolase
MEELKPQRRGRCAGCGTWREQYRALRMTGTEAAAQIRDGDVLAFSAMANWPRELDAALAQRLRTQGGHVEVDAHFIPAGTRLLTPECVDHVTYNTNFFGVERTLAPMGNVHYVPTHLSQTPDWLLSRHPRAAVLTCSPPDENGWMSRSIWGTCLNRRLLEQCELVLAEVHPDMPYIESDGPFHTKLHVSEVDGIIETAGPLWRLPPSPAMRRTGASPDTSPIWCLTAPVCSWAWGPGQRRGENLVYAGKRDLGVQTEVLSTGIMELMKAGVVNNSRKEVCTGRTVCAHLVGGQSLWDFARENAAFCQKEIDFVNDSRVIAQNRNVVSINNVLEIDLTGQANAETVGSRQYSGTGGQLEWVIGAQWSPGGKSILALRSSYTDKAGRLRSKIVPQLTPGSVVTTPRTWVQYVVTEYGVADLKYKSALERARALIAIAHPDFRRNWRPL